MIKYKRHDGKVIEVSETPLAKGLSVTCFIRYKNNKQSLCAFVKDDNHQKLSVVISSPCWCRFRTIREEKARAFIYKLNLIYQNKKDPKLNKMCHGDNSFMFVRSANFTSGELYAPLCKAIAEHVDCTEVWIEDENMETNTVDNITAQFIYVKRQ